MRCFECSDVGHKRSDCPHKMQVSGQKQPDPDAEHGDGAGTPPETRSCAAHLSGNSNHSNGDAIEG